MDKKDVARKKRRLEAIELEVQGYKSYKLKEYVKMAVDLIVLVATIIIFFLVLFGNPDMNYIPLLIVTCAVTGLSIVRAFGHGESISATNKELYNLKAETENINEKLDKMS